MSDDYASYVRDVMFTAPVCGWMRRLVREMLRVLWREGVVVDYIWFSMSDVRKDRKYVSMSAIAVDTDDEEVEAVARWEYDSDKVHTPTSKHWVLSDVELRDLPEGFVS